MCKYVYISYISLTYLDIFYIVVLDTKMQEKTCAGI
jgi:hypothetical protein